MLSNLFRVVVPVSVLIVMVMLMPVTGWAQTAPATIGGFVRDSSGGTIPGATVRFISEADRAAVEAVSDAQGAYRSSTLRPGSYRVETSLAGFDTVVSRVTLEPGQAPSIDVTLRPAGFAEGVVVTARRVEEVAQEVPIALSVVSGNFVDKAGAFNVNRQASSTGTASISS